MGVASGLSAQLGMVAEVYTNEVQSFDLSTGAPPTGGTFTLTFEGATTAAIAWNAAAATVQAALELLPNIGAGGVVCGGGALPSSQVTVTFSGPPVAGRNVGPLTANLAALTGGTPAFDWSTTTPGAGYGDANTVTRFLPFVSESVKMDITDTKSEAMFPGEFSTRSTRLYSTRRKVEGDLELEFLSKGMGLLLENAFGLDTITTPTNGVLTRRHRFTLADQRNKSLTVQVGRPDSVGGAGNVRPFTWQGGKLNGATLKLDTDGILMASFPFVAQDEYTDVALAAASYAAGSKGFHAGQTITVTLNGISYCVRDFEFSLDNALSTDRDFLCGVTLRQPLNAALRVATMSMEVEFADLAAYNLYRNTTIVPVAFTIKGDLIESVTPDYFEQIDITGTTCRVRSDGPVVEGPDILTQNLEVEFLYDGTNSPVILDWFTQDTAV